MGCLVRVRMENSNMKGGKLSTLVALVACGCAHQMTQPIADPALDPYSHSGTASIFGEVYYKERQGWVPSGESVTLIPNSPHLKEYIRHRNPEDEISNPPRYIRQSPVSQTGKFAFTKLPAGDYHLECEIQFADPGFFNPGHKTSVWIGRDITVKNGEHVDVTIDKRTD